MTTSELLRALLSARSTEDALTAVATFEAAHAGELSWHPFGRRNNRGTIEASGDTGRSLVERATNGFDAVLEFEHQKHNGTPVCTSPKDAAIAWLGVPDNGLSEMTTTQRRRLAQRVTITMEEGEGRDARLLSVRDLGSGISPADMPNTILSLSEDNKLQKHYLAGTFGQGGSSTLAACKLCVIASRNGEDGPIGFTVVKYLDLPPEQYKTGHYVYLGDTAGVLVAPDFEPQEFVQGTLCKHFAYDIDDYSAARGPNSVYGLLQMVLFDPVMPVWFENRVHGWNRVIKGSRNALNGAVDEGDENSRGPSLAHNMPMFYASLGDFGRIGIEYWVLQPASPDNKRPSASYVNDKRPIILTSNGQNHAEFNVSVIKKDAELPFLSTRLICHVDCDGLSPAAKRALFVSNREEARRGAVRNLIVQELVNVLKTDPDLERLNREAKDSSRKEQDETALARMRDEVARLLRLQGFELARAGGEVTEGGTDGRPTTERRPRPRAPLPAIEIQEPPTFIRFAWEEDDINFYPGQRRYLRVDTDASSTYFHSDPERSKIQFMVLGSDDLSVIGTAPLKGGRMRVGLSCQEGTEAGETGTIRVELQRVGLPMLSDERNVSVVEMPPVRGSNRRVTMPPFEVIPVEPDDENWIRLGWPDDRATVASSAEMSDGTLYIYYNAEFPSFAGKMFTFETKDTSLAESFRSRYEIWLAMHSLLMFQDQQQASANSSEEAEAGEAQAEASEAAEREERRRIANLSVMIAAREVALMPAAEAEAVG